MIILSQELFYMFRAVKFHRKAVSCRIQHRSLSLLTTVLLPQLCICSILYTGCFRRNIKYFRRWNYGLFRV